MRASCKADEKHDYFPLNRLIEASKLLHFQYNDSSSLVPGPSTNSSLSFQAARAIKDTAGG